MNLMIMAVGLPGTGKSTFFKKMQSDLADRFGDIAYLSTDKFIEIYARKENKTYDQVFETYIKTASQLVEEKLQNAIRNQRLIIWDQTNLSAKSRKSKLSKIPKTYFKMALIFDALEENQWQTILASRPGKTIPGHILKNMQSSYQVPTIAEGFDLVVRAQDWHLTTDQ